MKTDKVLRPMLRPEHFKGLETQMGSTGLTFNKTIDADVRRDAALNLDMDWDAMEEYYEQIDASRGPSIVKVNPRQPSAKALSALIESLEDKDQWRNCIPTRGYERQWQRKYANARQSNGVGRFVEGQSLIVVIFSGNEPVGYAQFYVSVNRDRGGKKLFLTIDTELTFILPKFRGKGYGLDLSIACGQICDDVLTAAYAAVPSGSTIIPMVIGDIFSKGGEAFIQQLVDALAFQVDMFREDCKRKTVTVDHVVNESGW
jgi:hypothetical protein